jgi:hypothetical protein
MAKRKRDLDIRADERGRIADALEAAIARDGDDIDPDRAFVFRELAKVLRIDREQLILAGLEAIIEEIKAEQGLR